MFCRDVAIPTTFMFYVPFSSSLRMPQQNSTKMDFPSGLCHQNRGCCCPPLNNTFYTESQISIPAKLILPSIAFWSPAILIRPCKCHSRIARKWPSPAASATRTGGYYCCPPLNNTFYTESQISIPANLILPSITFWSPAILILPSVTFWSPANLILPSITFYHTAEHHEFSKWHN